jgi:hypothetical protein
MAAKRSRVADVEKAEVALGKSEHGNDQPTLVIGIRTRDWIRGPHLARAVGLHAAAEVELALGAALDTSWGVNAPEWGNEQRLPEGWRTTFKIHLEGRRGANAEVAMKALRQVADSLRAGKGVRR